MTDPRDEILSLIRRLRGSLDPEVVRRLELAKEGKVPYDQAAAGDAVRRFLETRKDGGRFRSQLLEALRKGDH